MSSNNVVAERCTVQVCMACCGHVSCVHSCTEYHSCNLKLMSQQTYTYLNGTGIRCQLSSTGSW